MKCFALVGALAAFAASTVALGSEALPAQAGPRPDRAVLAWIRFVDGPERYADVPYLWLGKVDIHLQIDVQPQPGHVLEILWGSKDDARQAIATINGHDVEITAGGYNGFRWLSVPFPERVSGTSYEVTLRKGYAKPGFIAEVRLSRRDPAEAGPAPDLSQPASKITCKTGPPAPPEAFPEMRAVWDREPPPSPPRQRAANGNPRRVEAGHRVATGCQTFNAVTPRSPRTQAKSPAATALTHPRELEFASGA